MGLSRLLTATLLAFQALSGAVNAAPAVGTKAVEQRQAASSFWMANIKRQGAPAFGQAGYKIFRNVKDYGATGDGATDDTAAIQRAIADGNRCGGAPDAFCDSTTTTPAIVYFPPGTYMLSTSLRIHYYTWIVGDATNLPVLKATSSFEGQGGIGLIDADPYVEGKNWFTNQNNFWRQIRNLVIDITQAADDAAGIHWQVAQATSLQNIVFNMKQGGGNTQKGIFMDNGSGGFMTDLTFNGGGLAAFLGSQQFTTRNLTFNNCGTAIYMNWNWLWTFHDVTINNCEIGVDMSNGAAPGGLNGQTVGSVLLVDSQIQNTKIGVKTAYNTQATMTNGTLIIDNVNMGTGVESAVFNANDNITLVPGGQIGGFVQGRSYTGVNKASAIQNMGTQIPRSEALLSNGKLFTRSKPQYETIDASKFLSAKDNGAKGDGKTDDTAAVQAIFDKAAGTDNIVYFDHGAYLITDTVKVPKNIKIVGELWPLIMASGTGFSDKANPKPVFQVGQPGDVGAVEMSELIFETVGPQPGAIMMEWNLAQSAPGAAGMWDVHFRIGGSAGTQLQSDKCSKNPNATHAANPECEAAFMLLHVTKQASGYFENNWFWVADHELDLADHNQIDLYNGRGVFIESQGPVWLWGTSSEHSVLYNYQLSGAKDIFMGLIQTETAYMQGNPDATTPFPSNAKFNDPDFSKTCTSGSQNCARTWGLRVIDSSDILLYGGGLYSFFDNYNQDCLQTNSCQEHIVSIENSGVQILGLSTKASVNMLTVDGQPAALDTDNRNNFCATLAKFSTSGSGAASNGTEGSASSGGGSSGGGSGASSSRVASGTASPVPVPNPSPVPAVPSSNPAPVASPVPSAPAGGANGGSGGGAANTPTVPTPSPVNGGSGGAANTPAVPTPSPIGTGGTTGGSSGSGSSGGSNSGAGAPAPNFVTVTVTTTATAKPSCAPA